MNQCRDGGFEEIFMTKVDFPAKFDLFMRYMLKWIVILLPFLILVCKGKIPFFKKEVICLIRCVNDNSSQVTLES